MKITVDQYLHIFRFRGDTFAEQNPGGDYKRVTRGPTYQDLEDHLTHKRVLALYPSMNGLCWMGALDFDIPKAQAQDPEAWEAMEAKVRACYDMLKDLGIKQDPLIEKTGGRGYHIWVFSELIDVSLMYRFLSKVSEAAMADAEIFPTDTEALGKGIRPPLGTHKVYKGRSYFVDPITFEEVELDSKTIANIHNNRITEHFLLSVGIEKQTRSNFSHHNEDYSTIPKIDEFAIVFDTLRPCFQGIYIDSVETSGGQGFSFMTAASAEVLAHGGLDEHVHEYFGYQDQYDPHITNKHLRPIKAKSIAPYKCSTLQDRCGKYVLEYCDTCYLNKQRKLNKKLDSVVDKTQGKEERTDGNIEDTLAQFQPIALELDSIMSNDKYTLLVNNFNGGKSWSCVAFMERIVHTLGQRCNFITPSKQVKKIILERLDKAGVNYLDNPGNLDMCPRAEKFKDIGYLPSMACKSCKRYVPVRELIKPVMEDYYEVCDKFKGDLNFFSELAEKHGTCAKWIYLSLLEATREENLVLVMTAQKLKHHLFIDDSPLIPAVSLPQLYANIIDQIDFVNRTIPNRPFSEEKIYADMRMLGIANISELEMAKEMLAEKIIMLEDIEPQDLKEMAAIDHLNQWIYCEDMFDRGYFRRVHNSQYPDKYVYDYAGERELRLVMTDVVGKNLNPRLYDSVIKYFEDLEVKHVSGVEVVPQSFKEIMESITKCTATMGITATPTEIEAIRSPWLHDYQENESACNILKNLYSIPSGSILEGTDIDSKKIIFSRKINEDAEYINDGMVRGNTGTGGRREEIIIEGLQYPKHSEKVMCDIIQLCGGNIGQGVKVFYENLINDAITQAHKYEAEKIFVPNRELFTALGYQVHDDDELSMTLWLEKFIKRMGKKDGLFKDALQAFPDDVLDMLVEKGLLLLKGKKYVLGEQI